MLNKKKPNFSSNMFTYSGYRCKCVQDIENLNPDMPPKIILKIVAVKKNPLIFSYVAQQGLSITGVAGKMKEENILGRLLAIPTGNAEKHIEFIEKYGFLLQLPDDKYFAINIDDIFTVFNRIKATVRLINAITKRDYKSVLRNATYLLFSPIISIQIDDEIRTTCPHLFNKLLNSYNQFPDFEQDEDVFETGEIAVSDTMRGEYQLDYEYYQDVKSGDEEKHKGSKTKLYKNLMAMYVGYPKNDDNLRLLIDFYYHFQTEISIIEKVLPGKIKLFEEKNIDSYIDMYKDALIKIGRIVVSEEVNYNIAGIHPKYDGYDMNASWQIDNLIDALYFSIFYMKAGEDIYKKCENVNCNRDQYFLVKATRGNKKYCCIQCGKAVAAQKLRDKERSK